MIVAVDGPVAAGKGTLSRRLAEHFDFAYLDTGALYRAVAFGMLQRHDDIDDTAQAVAAAQSLDASTLDDPRLRDEGVGEAASRIAALPPLRAALLAFQRRFAEAPPENKAGAVLDGRDIGTAVCPDAAVKLFVTADIAVRARRRFLQLSEAGAEVAYETVLSDLKRRDARDSGRAVRPLKPAADATILDTTAMSIDEAFTAATALVAQAQ